MNYETQHYIGDYQHTRTETATTVAPTIGRVRHVATKAKGCKPGAERQTEIRTNSNAPNGILKCTFLPKFNPAQSVLSCGKTERDFYKSLSRLAEHYSIEPMQTKDFGFPYNIALSMWDMEGKLKRKHRNWNSLKLVQDNKKTFIESEERYDTGTTLYYFPVTPLLRMLHDKQRKHSAQLLLSVFSYLYHIADIPYYRQDNYMFWMYEMHKDWVEQDEETDATETYKSELRNAEYFGYRMEQKLFNRHNLMYFKLRLGRFTRLHLVLKSAWITPCDPKNAHDKYGKI